MLFMDLNRKPLPNSMTMGNNLNEFTTPFVCQALEFAKTISKPPPSSRTSECSPPAPSRLSVGKQDRANEPSELDRLEAQHRQDQERVEVS